MYTVDRQYLRARRAAQTVVRRYLRAQRAAQIEGQQSVVGGLRFGPVQTLNGLVDSGWIWYGLKSLFPGKGKCIPSFPYSGPRPSVR